MVRTMTGVMKIPSKWVCPNPSCKSPFCERRTIKEGKGKHIIIRKVKCCKMCGAHR